MALGPGDQLARNAFESRRQTLLDQRQDRVRRQESVEVPAALTDRPVKQCRQRPPVSPRLFRLLLRLRLRRRLMLFVHAKIP